MSFALKYLGPSSLAGYSEKNLEALVDLSVEENLNLDYKNIKKFEDPDGLSIAVSAMANAAGGLIVLGVDENKELDERGNPIRILPGRITWGPKSHSKEKLESRLVSRIRPWINGLRIHPVRNTHGAVVFLIDVPQSSNPPHQAHDNRYYLRHNFQNLAMTHYQVAALFQKRFRPEIVPRMTVTKFDENGYAELSMELENVGGAIAKYLLVITEASGCKSFTTHSMMTGASVESSQISSDKHFVKYMDKDFYLHPATSVPLTKITTQVDQVVAFEVAIAAEEMPTTLFTAGFAIDHLRKVAKPNSNIVLPLKMLSEGELDIDKHHNILEQMGVSPEDFDLSLDGLTKEEKRSMSLRELVLRATGK